MTLALGWLRRRLSVILGSVHVEKCEFLGRPVLLQETPEAWAITGGVGAVVLDWSVHLPFHLPPDLQFLCATDKLARRLRNAVEIDRRCEGTKPMAKVRPIADQSLCFVSGPEFVAGFVAPEYVLDGVIQRGYLYAITGQTGHGKTAAGIYLARCVERGEPFVGHEVGRGNALILAGENPDDIRARLILSEAVHGWPITDRLMVIPSTFRIEDDIEQIAESAKAVGGLSLVLVDTLAAYLDGDDENANSQLGGFARVLRKLTTVPGHPTVIVNCHPTKNATKDNLVPRGGGAFLAEIDGNLTLWSEDKTALQISHHRKFRGPGFEPIDLKLETRTCKTLVDRKGRPIPSVVALPMTEEEAASLAQAARSDEDAVLDMLLNYPNGSYAAWCKTLGWIGATGLPLKSPVNRAMTSLEKDRPGGERTARLDLD